MKRNKQFYQEREYRKFQRNDSWDANYRNQNFGKNSTQEYKSWEYVVIPNKDFLPCDDWKAYEEIAKCITFVPYKGYSVSDYEDYKRRLIHNNFSKWCYVVVLNMRSLIPNEREINRLNLNGLISSGYNYSININTDLLTKDRNKEYWEKYLYLKRHELRFTNEYYYKVAVKNLNHFKVEKQLVIRTNRYSEGDIGGYLYQKMGGDYETHKFHKQYNKFYGRYIDEDWRYRKHQPDFKAKRWFRDEDRAWINGDVEEIQWLNNEYYYNRDVKKYDIENYKYYTDWLEYDKKQKEPIQYGDPICKDGVYDEDYFIYGMEW